MPCPAGVPAYLPAPQPNGSTSLRLPCGSSTTSASSGNFPPPRGCSRPKRTKWLFGRSTACLMGRIYGAMDDRMCVEGSWQRIKAWSDGEVMYSSGKMELRKVSSGLQQRTIRLTRADRNESERFLVLKVQRSTHPFCTFANYHAPQVLQAASSYLRVSRRHRRSTPPQLQSHPTHRARTTTVVRPGLLQRITQRR